MIPKYEIILNTTSAAPVVRQRNNSKPGVAKVLSTEYDGITFPNSNLVAQ